LDFVQQIYFYPDLEFPEKSDPDLKNIILDPQHFSSSTNSIVSPCQSRIFKGHMQENLGGSLQDLSGSG